MNDLRVLKSQVRQCWCAAICMSILAALSAPFKKLPAAHLTEATLLNVPVPKAQIER